MIQLLKISINTKELHLRFEVTNNNILSLISPRDAAAVQSILDLSGNGLVTFGTAHSHGIKQGLIAACRDGSGSL